MNKIAVITDTNSGISPEQAREYGVFLLPMPVIIDGEIYFEYISIGQAEFFDRLRRGAEVKTPQPSPGDLMDAWERALEDCDELVYIPMSSGLSGGCETARTLAREYGGRVHVADNHRISVTQRQSVLEARRMADEGQSAADIVAALERDAFSPGIYVAVNTLEYLKRSGRVTAAGAAVGTLLSIKPVLQIQGQKLDAFKKARGMKSAMRAIIEGLENDRRIRYAGQRVTLRAAWSGDEAQGELWRQELAAAFPDLTVEKDPLPISIACHVGDGALGVGIMPVR